MNIEITLNVEKTRELPNGSVCDPEVIRQISLYSLITGDDSLNDKIKPGFEAFGLYPHVMNRLFFAPELNKKADDEPRFSVKEIEAYLLSQDSMGDMIYNLSAANIMKANVNEEEEEEEDE